MESRSHSFSVRRHGGLLLSTVCLLLSQGCGADPPRLYCAAGIRGPVDELAKEFGRRHDLTFECDYRGSEVLLSAVKLTGEGDLYMPADVYYVEMAEEAGLIVPDSTRATCYFIPVIMVRKGNPKKIFTLADLTRPEVEVGLGNPDACAIGRKSMKLLAKNDIDSAKVNVVVHTSTVNELGNHIKLKAVDAVIVWDAVAALYPDDAEAVSIPLQQNIISTVSVGVLRSSKHPKLAAEFIEFVCSEDGREVFRKHHYTIRLPEQQVPE